MVISFLNTSEPAAFGRLCVETGAAANLKSTEWPAAFGRLCVETPVNSIPELRQDQPPSGGCVLKPVKVYRWDDEGASRLRAAVC